MRSSHARTWAEYRHVTECKGSQPMGRTPEGDQAQTGAERQARYRQRLTLERPSAQPLAKRPSRACPLSRRWLDTVATLVSLQAEYVSMPLQIRSYLLKRRQISVLGFGAPDCPGSP